MDKETIKTLKKFVNDEEWKVMEDFIAERLQIDDRVLTIDTKEHPSVIIGEIKSRQLLAKRKEMLIANFAEIANYELDKPAKKALR